MEDASENFLQFLQVNDVTIVIDNFLYLSSMKAARSIDVIERLGITHIVNATNRSVGNSFQDSPYNVKYFNVDCDDSEIYSIAKYFEPVIGFINDAKSDDSNQSSSKNGKVLVHCMCGISRSVSLILAYLMYAQCIDLRTAYYFVKEKRDFISPNESFAEELLSFEKDLFGSNTIEVSEITSAWYMRHKKQASNDIKDLWATSEEKACRIM
jgi:hypothetical protein